MENTVFIKKYTESELPPVNENEVWRYAGYKGKTDGISAELLHEFNSVQADLNGKFNYAVCYVKTDKPYPLESKSASLKKLLEGGCGCVIFAATVGLPLDRYIMRMQKSSQIKALLANALGAERIEALCDTFCRDLGAELAGSGLYLTKRFSAGYGDLPLSAQTEIFSILDCSRKIGVSLNESLLMSPSKSVTAIMGIKTQKCVNLQTHKCECCDNKNCQFRKQENI